MRAGRAINTLSWKWLRTLWPSAPSNPSYWSRNGERVRQGGFFSELKRRRVARVAGAYVIVVWMALEILLETGPILGMPGWVARLAVTLGFIGFPVTIVLAWVYDLTSDGVIRTPSLEEQEQHGVEPDAPMVVRPRPIRLAGVFGAGIIVALVGFGAYAAFSPSSVIRPAAIQSVAVLPFHDLSQAGDQGYFADGVAEELINRLARVGDLRVAARTSSFAFRDREAALPEIARELGVDAVVEGSVRRSGDQLRVTVELVDAATGFQLWSEKYDRAVDDIFAIQDDIATAIVDALQVHLSPSASSLRAGTDNVRAHDAYLLGLARWHARTEDDLTRALEYFEEALAEDRSYAPAYAGVALTYAVLPAYGEVPAELAAERGSEAAARALALDAQNAEAHAAIGQIAQGLEWNLEAAEMAYTRALEFQPSYATGHQWYAELLLVMGRLQEARLEIERALAIDPLSVGSRKVLADLQMLTRDFTAARDGYVRITGEHPRYVPAQRGLLQLCLAADCHRLAGAAARAGYEPSIADVLLAVVAADRDGVGVAAALQSLERLDGILPPGEAALYRSALGDRAGALDRLETAYAEGGDPHLPLRLVHPLFDPLRREPRFAAIADALGVEAPMAGLPNR